MIFTKASNFVVGTILAGSSHVATAYSCTTSDLKQGIKRKYLARQILTAPVTKHELYCVIIIQLNLT